MQVSNFFDTQAGKDVANAAGSFFTAGAIKLAERAGVNLGNSSPQARARPPIQGGATQAPQAVLVTTPWWKKPIAIIVGVGVVIGVVWALARGK